MSKITKIQWCDTTVNPIAGCRGCELFPSAGDVLDAINLGAATTGATIDSRKLYTALIDECFSRIPNPATGFKQAVNTTNIWHLREKFVARVTDLHGEAAAIAAGVAIRKAVTCYAAILHLNKAQSIVNPTRMPNKGYAPIFESVSRFAGRAAETAKLPDLLGQANPETPWKNRLPRMIFVSDMGDAFSSIGDFGFLKGDLLPAITSDAGIRHLWLWLTKRPEHMAKFAAEIGGFPDNVCAMTTLTGPDERCLKRLADLKLVEASIRGLSIEPLWDRIPPAKLNLTGIDWVIAGGESGSGELTRPFALEWAMELRDHCRKQGVAFFLKQLGRNPTRGGMPVKLKDKHGGNWEEWEISLRVREFPRAFHEFRKDEFQFSDKPRPVKKPKKS